MYGYIALICICICMYICVLSKHALLNNYH